MLLGFVCRDEREWVDLRRVGDIRLSLSISTLPFVLSFRFFTLLAFFPLRPSSSFFHCHRRPRLPALRPSSLDTVPLTSLPSISIPDTTLTPARSSRARSSASKTSRQRGPVRTTPTRWGSRVYPTPRKRPFSTPGTS
ncbi:hypothetical protein B0H17DRAFT_1046877 [Mycena rosella]|uniref:Uncharacterized protein n=1 Tax=Mycena rosella TaxID=1033263 RepID=A0AAD7DVR0_MYCRO|nr:hypothetical protein B0H17DRAFT_1046877 [Mycena rosella]